MVIKDYYLIIFYLMESEKRVIGLDLIVNTKKLKSMNKIAAHKEIFSILKDEMKNKIHALEIEIN